MYGIFVEQILVSVLKIPVCIRFLCNGRICKFICEPLLFFAHITNGIQVDFCNAICIFS